MQAELNAMGVLAPVVATVLVLRQYGAWRTTVWRILAAVAAILVLLACIPWLFCPRPYAQFLVPGLCTFLVIAFVARSLPRCIAAIAFLMVSFALSMQFHSLAATDRYTSDPMEPRDLIIAVHGNPLKELASEERPARMAGEGSPSADRARTYEAGWLDELYARLGVAGSVPELHSVPIVGRAWYTPITGLYPLRGKFECRLWFPGGTFAEGAERLELREVPR